MNYNVKHQSKRFCSSIASRSELYDGNMRDMNFGIPSKITQEPVFQSCNFTKYEKLSYKTDLIAQGEGDEIEELSDVFQVEIPENEENSFTSVKNYENDKVNIKRIKRSASKTCKIDTLQTENKGGTKKKIGLACNSDHCLNSQYRYCSSFNEQTRKTIFNEFWNHLNRDQRQIFVATHAFKKPQNSHQSLDNLKIENDFIFTLRNSSGNDEQVCEEMFLNTLALNKEDIKLWVQKYSLGGDGISTYREELQKKIVKNNESLAKGVKKGRKEKPGKWKFGVRKKLRMEGKEYYSKNHKTGELVLHKGKDLGPRCNSVVCKTSKLRNCNKISDATRVKIFNDIWQKWDWNQRKIWVASMVKKKATNRKCTLSIDSKRQSTLNYFLPDNNGIPTQVCKKMFIDTTGIGPYQTVMWANSYSLGSNFEELVISRKDANNHALEWINMLPTYFFGIESEFKYLDPQFRSIKDLYKIYLDRCKNDEIKINEKYKIKRLIKYKNIRFVPQNDEECERCRIFSKSKDKNNIDDTIKYHQVRAEQGTAQKSKDQNKALSGLSHILQIHLQPMKTLPILRNEIQIFKSKLQCNNLSIYDVRANYTTCYFFTEDQCSNIPDNFQNIITTIICEHLKENYLIAKKKLPIILYCDGSTDKTRNIILANALLNLAATYNIKITQKFFETGHSLVEDCYKTHQILERFLNTKDKEIYLPSQLAKTLREIKRCPEIFTGIHLEFDFFRDYSKPEFFRYKSIHPGDGFEENDACEMHYNPTGKITLKLEFNGESMDLLQKSTKDFKAIYEYPELYTEMACIQKTKWDDLQDMKKFMPFDCQVFYDSLKYED